jgi:hypothetical protein
MLKGNRQIGVLFPGFLKREDYGYSGKIRSGERSGCPEKMKTHSAHAGPALTIIPGAGDYP